MASFQSLALWKMFARLISGTSWKRKASDGQWGFCHWNCLRISKTNRGLQHRPLSRGHCLLRCLVTWEVARQTYRPIKGCLDPSPLTHAHTHTQSCSQEWQTLQLHSQLKISSLRSPSRCRYFLDALTLVFFPKDETRSQRQEKLSVWPPSFGSCITGEGTQTEGAAGRRQKGLSDALTGFYPAAATEFLYDTG